MRKNALCRMLPGHLPNCGRSLLAGDAQWAVGIKLEGCRGTFSGAVFFRIAMTVVPNTISNTRTTAKATIFLPDFGLPAIITEGEMRI